MTPPRIEWKINAGHLLTLIILVLGFTAGYVRLQAREDELEQRFHAHEAYDDKRFDAFATKETRAARDSEVNARLDMIAKRLDEANARLERIERIHMIGGRP
jgi:hypothetical protein